MNNPEAHGTPFLDHPSTGDIELVIAGGVAHSRFSSASAVGLFEASPTSENWQASLDDEGLAKKLKQIQSDPADTVRTRTFFVPWASIDQRLAITPSSLSALCSTFDISLLFVEGILDVNYWVKPGNGLFLHYADNGHPSKLEIFYRYSFGLTSGRAYVFTTYDFTSKATTNICISCIPEVKARWIAKAGAQVGLSTSEQPLALHSLLASQVLNYLNLDGSQARSELLEDEVNLRVTKPKAKATKLHRLAQTLHVLLEDLNDLEGRITFLIKVSERLTKALQLSGSCESFEADKDMLEYLLSKCNHSKRWLANYRDRANIRINLAFHLSTQVDNDLNLQISKATTAIARDAQKDSSSMITIAAVTMFFLPGTFVSAVFSMVFFNFQQDSNGQQEFQVSSRWWYFLAVTVPLTCVVFAIWILWQRIRFRNNQLEEDTRNHLSGGVELDVLNAADQTVTVNPNNPIWSKSLRVEQYLSRKRSQGSV